MRKCWKYGLMLSALAVSLMGGKVLPVEAAYAEVEEKMELLQDGEFLTPDEDYSFQEGSVKALSDIPAVLSDALDEEEAKRQAAIEARANNNATLKDRQQACAKVLYNSMVALEKQIDVARFALSREEFKVVISNVVNSNPELFYIRNGYKINTFTLSETDDTEIVDYCIGFYEYQDKDYNPNTTRIRALATQLENKRSAILNEMLTTSMTQPEKLLMIHEYLVLHTEYDSQAVLDNRENADVPIPDSDFDIYGALIDGKAVCQGYALAYRYLLEGAGISNTGYASNTNHVWNTVTVNGAGYYVDCTWDDTEWDTLGNVRHTYFLKGEADFKDHGIFETDRICEGSSFNKTFWNGVASGIFYRRGGYYYVDEKGNLCKAVRTDRSSAAFSTQVISSLKLTKTDSWNYSNAAKIAAGDDYIVYHDQKNLYAYNLAKSESKLLYTPDLTSNELIYGVSLQDGIFQYATRLQNVSGGNVSYNNVAQNKVTYVLPESPFRVPVESVTISGGTVVHLIMKDNKLVSDNLDLRATVLPENATDKRIRRWTSSNTSVAVVDINGRVKGVAPGTVVITAESYDGVQGVYSVEVTYNGPITNANGQTVYYENGKQVKNQFYTIDGKKYYVGNNGFVVTGWQTIGGKRYYFNAEGVMAIGWQTIDGGRYYFDANGVMLTGWQTIAGKKYYSENGRFVTGFKKISGKKYYFSKSGAMVTGWKTIKKGRYHFDENGVMATGWKTINKKRYYFKSSGKMVKGWQTIKRAKYYFNKKGIMATGWKTIKGNRYYFKSNGKMVKGWQTIKGVRYHFNAKGIMAVGWQQIGGQQYYFDSKGKMVTGWYSIGNSRYYFHESGVMAIGWLALEGRQYYFNDQGAMVIGWQQIQGRQYYFDKNGVMVTGLQVIDRISYYFAEDGHLVS